MLCSGSDAGAQPLHLRNAKEPRILLKVSSNAVNRARVSFHPEGRHATIESPDVARRQRHGNELLPRDLSFEIFEGRLQCANDGRYFDDPRPAVSLQSRLSQRETSVAAQLSRSIGRASTSRFNCACVNVAKSALGRATTLQLPAPSGGMTEKRVLARIDARFSHLQVSLEKGFERGFASKLAFSFWPGSVLLAAIVGLYAR